MTLKLKLCLLAHISTLLLNVRVFVSPAAAVLTFCVCIYPLPNNRILHLSKLKAFADDKRGSKT